MTIIIDSKLDCLSSNSKLLIDIINRRFRIIGREYRHELIGKLIFTDKVNKYLAKSDAVCKGVLLETWDSSISLFYTNAGKDRYIILLPSEWLNDAIESHDTQNMDISLEWHIAKIHFHSKQQFDDAAH